MDNIAMTSTGDYICELSEDEKGILLVVSRDRGTLPATVFRDTVEMAISRLACVACQRMKLNRRCPPDALPTVQVHVEWPDTGPFASFDVADKEFVGNILGMSLREALSMVMYTRQYTGDNNGMERKDS